MDFQIHGSTLQSLTIQLGAGEAVFSETGCVLHMTPNISLRTSFQGGIGGVLRRMVTGNSLSLNYFEADGKTGEVAFTTRMPGHIVPFEIRDGRSIFVQRHSFLCATTGCLLELGKKFNLYGILGGNGLVVNHLHGDGTAFVSVDGEVITRELESGESILIHPGHLAAYEETVDVSIQRVRGVKNLFFGGDGLSFVRATGPGRVWMNSLTIHHLAELLAEYGLGRSSNRDRK